MSESKGYNGWTNYETWNVALWLDNEQYSAHYWAQAGLEALESARGSRESGFSSKEIASRNLAQQLKDEIEESNPLADQSSMFSDLISAALSEVNWDEIAEHYVGEHCEDDDEKESADDISEDDAE